MSVHQSAKASTIEAGLIFFPIGIYMLISGAARAGRLWESYSAWQPLSSIVLALAVFCFAIPFWKKFKVSWRSTRTTGGSDLRNLVLFLLFVVGFPIVSVATRGMSLGFDPFSLYIGLGVCVLIISVFGFNRLLLSFTLIFFITALFGRNVAAPNPLNDNMLEAYMYSLSMGLFLFSWGILSIIRHRNLAESDAEEAGA